MRISICLALILTLAGLALADRPKIIVERPTPGAGDTTEVVAPQGQRMVIDPSAMIYQARMDSINTAAEDKIRNLIIKLEHKFQDPVVEEQVGRLIGTAVMEQQMALLDLQMERAVSLKDTLLMVGLETAIRELLINSDVVRIEAQKLLDRLAAEAQAR